MKLQTDTRVHGTTNLVATTEVPLCDSTTCPLNTTSTAYEASRVIKASKGVLYSIIGYNSNTSSQFILIFDSAILPAEGSVPIQIITVPGSSNFIYSSDKFGRYFTNGIVVCNSSTGPTKTIGTTDCWFDCQYK